MCLPMDTEAIQSLLSTSENESKHSMGSGGIVVH